jgi:hypothetical protein
MCSDKNGCNKEEWQNNPTSRATTGEGLLSAQSLALWFP